MTIATISSEGQVAIPKSVRERLNLTPGTQIAMDVLGESLVLKRVVSEGPDWRTMRGLASGSDSLTQALIEERAADKARDDGRIKGS